MIPSAALDVDAQPDVGVGSTVLLYIKTEESEGGRGADFRIIGAAKALDPGSAVGNEADFGDLLDGVGSP